MDQSQNHSTECLSCGEPVAGRYCSSCGEKVLKDKEKTVSHFLMQALHVLTHADGKFFKSLGCILFRPGTLTVNYLEGRRRRYMSPLSIFVFANLLYLLFSPVDALNSAYPSQKAQLYGEVAERKFGEKMKAKGWSELQLSERYNAKSGKLAKLLLIVLVLYFSIPLAIVYFSTKRYYVDHLVFSTEVINFLILVVFLIMPWLIELVFLAVYHWFGIEIYVDFNDSIALLFLIIGLLVYLSMAARRVYRTKWWVAVAKSVILFLGLFFCVVLYRFTLFQATMAML